jgi:RNA 2',3'-cyclic 3'-phosphodiesterase
MNVQTSFFGDAPVITDRLFFSINPDAATAARIVRLAQELSAKNGLRGKIHAPERLHITINHLGDHAGVPQNIVDAAAEAAMNVKMAPFDVTFDFAGSFFNKDNNNPFVLRGGDGLAALIAFQQKLGLEMMKAGLKRFVEKTFTPHVTMSYDKVRIEDQPIEPITWTAGEFILIHSLLGKTQHKVLGRWPIRA